MITTFEISQVNPIRMRRGVEGVSMEIFEDGEFAGTLWMSERDIRRNIKDHGTCEAFEIGLECYKKQRDVRIGKGGGE